MLHSLSPQVWFLRKNFREETQRGKWRETKEGAASSLHPVGPRTQAALIKESAAAAVTAWAMHQKSCGPRIKANKKK